MSPLEAMEEHIRAWHDWMRSLGTFYDSRNLGQPIPTRARCIIDTLTTDMPMPFRGPAAERNPFPLTETNGNG